MLLLSCSKSYAQQTNDSIPSTGGVKCSDSAVVAVPVILIKKANAKMIERNYLLYITNEQDSIIRMKDKYINEQQKIIIDFQKKVNATVKLNEAVKKDLEKQKTKNKIIGYGAGATIIGLIISFIIK